MNSVLTEREAPPADVVAEGFTQERADRYAAAQQAVPGARHNEGVRLRAALDRLGIAQMSTVVELGTGQGFGTACILERLTPKGIVHGVDASSYMLDHAKEDPRLHRHVGALDQLRLPNESVDFAFSLAAFHHIPNKWLTMRELWRVLRPGAAFLAVDVTHDTQAQRVFDYIVRPYCSSGHDADFLDEAWAGVLARNAGFTLESLSVESTDWTFDSEDAMTRYTHDLFSLQTSQPHVRELLQRWVTPYVAEGRWVMPWSLGFYVFRKA
jgi:ubiquinone/menaquinone biosynthesis C-methylase UbiE